MIYTSDIDALFYDSIDLLKSMISIPSFSGKEKKVADLIEKYISGTGYLPKRKGDNIWLLSPDFVNSKPTILLYSHTDTFESLSGWKKNPFSPEIEDDVLYGLGSNSSGASLVSLLHAFFKIIEKEQDYNLVFLASPEENILGENGIISILNDIPVPEFAIVGMPTGMNSVIAEKGLMILDCIAYGKPENMSGNKMNAIYKAMEDIQWIKSYSFADESELLGRVEMIVSTINARTHNDNIPDECEFTVQVRSNEFYTNKEIFELISRNTVSEIKARSFALNSSKIPVENPFVQRALMIGKTAVGSSTVSSRALMPFPSVKIGPGDPLRSHIADEYIRLSEIREAIEYYVKLLDGLRI